MSIDFKNEDEVKDYIKNLGTEYRFGCFKEKKPEVCHLLGDYLESISKDYHKAGRVYKSNCDDYNFAKSCYKMGYYYISGKGGFERSTEKSSQYYEKGCDLGDTDSCFRAGFVNIITSKAQNSKQGFLQGLSRLKKGCDANHADACHHLSSLYLDENSNTKDFLSKDMKKAFEFAQKACHLGNIYACVNVSIMYRKGEGVEKDQKKSENYKKMALDKKKEQENERPLVFQEGLK
ncbi:cytochrome c oxidase assembly factor 7 homolog [Cimex lectularius]|uniref:Cytochrome c oxidase assembly factor 7 homolog n=1 Tax=Cimex lectularius TaxID=79782 RepID=A0A8I6RH61_CIMLE|nr:cytochrome c oxidase assembly factor 7 homolog [Cimex lectularius]